jgi:hypothetical protein
MAAAAAIAILPFATTPVAGQQPKGKGGKGQKADAPPPGPAPRLSNGKPDLNGVWQRPYVPDLTKQGPNLKTSELSFTDEGKKLWESYNVAEGDYAGACLPFGLVRSINAPHPMRIVQSNTHVALLHEQNTWFHFFATDGRPNPVDTPRWFGYSEGHWDGDTLVVETKGFNGKTRLDTIGHPHSDQMTTVETWLRTDDQHIAYTITITDPKYYTKPIKSERIFTIRPDWEVMEYSCEENNKSLFEGRIKAPDYDKK